MIDKSYLKELSKEQGVDLDEIALERFDKYAELLVYWNERINLTAITDPKEIITKHFVDCLVLLNYIDIPLESSYIDVGTGAGFPGVVLLIARPDLNATLLDSTKKKLTVIEEILKELGLSANILHSRAEDAAKKAEYREQFDFVTARAVTNMRNLCEYCLPFIHCKGQFIAMKGAEAKAELSEAKRAIDILGGKVTGFEQFTLKDCGERAIITIEKISQTPSKYPRPSAQITKKPLI